MIPSFSKIATPVFWGAGLTWGSVLIWMIYAKFRKRGSDRSGFWQTVLHAGGKAPSLRDKMILSGLIVLVTGGLLAALYAWIIGFDSFKGMVEEKTVTSLGRYGDYAFRVEGEIHRVSLTVYRAAEKGSQVNRPWGRPYIVVDGTPHVFAWPLGFFGAIGTMLLFVSSVVLFLCWWPCREGLGSR